MQNHEENPLVLFILLHNICILRFLMISQKPRGKISGLQETENGKIQWSSEFPRSCTVSR